jgi:hypothetical protein
MASKKQAVEKFLEGKVASALNIAKGFKIGVTDKEREVMSLGYECAKRPEDYKQMGYDTEKCFDDAVQVLKQVLDIQEESVEEIKEEENMEKQNEVMAEVTSNQEDAEVEVTGSFGYGIDEMDKAFAEENARGEGVDTDDTNQEYPTEEEYAESIKVAEAIGLGKDVEGECVEDGVETEPEENEPEKNVWFLTVKDRKTKALSVKMLLDESLNDVIKNLKSRGYSFVCLVNRAKATQYVDTQSLVGMKGVLKALDGKLTVEANAYFAKLLELLESCIEELELGTCWVDVPVEDTVFVQPVVQEAEETAAE